MKHLRILAVVIVSAVLLPVCANAQYINETFEADAVGVAPTDLAQRNSTQVTNLAVGAGVIGNNNAAWFNDTSTAVSGSIEYNVGASALGSLYIQFDLLNNAPNTAGTAANVFNFSVGAWNNTSGANFLNNNANGAFRVGFFQTGASSTLTLRSNNIAVVSTTYDMSVLQSVKIWVNDNDISTLLYTRPDNSSTATLGANSAVVWINNLLVGTELDSGFIMNSVVATGDATIGRLGFNTTGANTGNWLIDNLYVSDVPVVPEPSSAALLLGGGVLLAWRSRRQITVR